jgi:tetratricopeptide (TPR) repeat protein
LETAVQLKPSLADAQYNLGVARLQARNDSAGALACFRKVLEIDPTHVSAKQAVELVGGLDNSKAQLMAAARVKANEPVKVPMPAKDPTPDTSLVGKTVVVCDLVSKAEMNGVQGVVSGFDPTTQRYSVTVVVNGAEVVAKLKPINFKVCEGVVPPPPPPPVAAAEVAAPQAGAPASLEKSMGELSVAAESGQKKNKRSVRASFVMTVTYTLEELRNGKYGEGVDPTRKETYLSDDAFEEAFKMTRDEFSRLPNWKKANKRKELQIF